MPSSALPLRHCAGRQPLSPATHPRRRYHRGAVARAYARGALAPDVLSALPFDLLLSAASVSSAGSALALKLLRLPRLLRLSRLLRKVRRAGCARLSTSWVLTGH